MDPLPFELLSCKEPMLFTGTLRHNLDPFKTYTDGRIKHLWQHFRFHGFHPRLLSDDP